MIWNTFFLHGFNHSAVQWNDAEGQIIMDKYRTIGTSFTIRKRYHQIRRKNTSFSFSTSSASQCSDCYWKITKIILNSKNALEKQEKLKKIDQFLVFDVTENTAIEVLTICFSFRWDIWTSYYKNRRSTVIWTKSPGFSMELETTTVMITNNKIIWIYYNRIKNERFRWIDLLICFQLFTNFLRLIERV